MQQTATQPAPAGSLQQAQITAEQKKALVTQVLEKRLKSGANWFLWIAGLSLANSLSAVAGSHFRFIVGLGLTQIIDHLAGSARAAAMVLDVIAAGIFIGFGMLGRKRQEWAFIVGMILYVLDSLLFVLAKDVVSIAFHLLALFYLYRGLKANEALTRLGATAHA